MRVTNINRVTVRVRARVRVGRLRLVCNFARIKTAAFLLIFSGKSMAPMVYKEKLHKKCRFATFTYCLRIASVLAHAHNYLSTTVLLLASRT